VRNYAARLTSRSFGTPRPSTNAAAAVAIEELVRRRILHGTGHELDFTHEYLRAGAYESLTLGHRRLLHRAVATAHGISAGTSA
jgi:ribosomal protein S12 methylthiotransferase accessory factor YcaO